MIPITDTQSERICGIRTVDDSWLFIIGVYLRVPCLDLGMELCHDTLLDLGRVISQSTHLGPVVI